MSGGYSTSGGACADSVNTTYWSVSGGPSGVVYTSKYGSGTVSGGSYYTTGVTVYLAGGSGYLYPYGSCCVLEGTLISTSTSSSVAVETLAVSDSVLSKDINLFDDDMTVEELRVWSGSNIDGSQTNAIVNTNQSEYDKYMATYNKRQKERDKNVALQKEVSELKSEMSDIKSLLLTIDNSKTG